MRKTSLARKAQFILDSGVAFTEDLGHTKLARVLNVDGKKGMFTYIYSLPPEAEEIVKGEIGQGPINPISIEFTNQIEQGAGMDLARLTFPSFVRIKPVICQPITTAYREITSLTPAINYHNNGFLRTWFATRALTMDEPVKLVEIESVIPMPGHFSWRQVVKCKLYSIPGASEESEITRSKYRARAKNHPIQNFPYAGTAMINSMRLELI
jgi:hypothetical protein